MTLKRKGRTGYGLPGRLFALDVGWWLGCSRDNQNAAFPTPPQPPRLLIAGQI
jgi:hypothetical protein